MPKCERKNTDGSDHELCQNPVAVEGQPCHVHGGTPAGGATGGDAGTHAVTAAAQAGVAPDPFHSDDLSDDLDGIDKTWLSLLDHAATTEKPPSVRKARHDARLALTEAFQRTRGVKGVPPDIAVNNLRTAARRALDAAAELAAAARLLETRDNDKWEAKKLAHGGGALPSLSGDEEFITAEQAPDDYAGWVAKQVADSTDPDEELQQLLGDNPDDDDS